MGDGPDGAAAILAWPISERILVSSLGHVALRMIGRYSVRAIEELLPLVLDSRLSYGSIEAVLHRAEASAGRFNDTMSLSSVQSAALDEMFSQGEQVLTAVDLDFGLVIAADLQGGRASTDWQQTLQSCQQRGLELKVCVRDGAAGIADATRQVFPEAEQRDDCFHALVRIHPTRAKRIYPGLHGSAMAFLATTRASLLKVALAMVHVRPFVARAVFPPSAAWPRRDPF